MHKELYRRFLFVFVIHIYSEDRLIDQPGSLYKHFLTIFFLGFKVFHVFWKTGISGNGKLSESGFYNPKGEDYNHYPVPSHKCLSLMDRGCKLIWKI